MDIAGLVNAVMASFNTIMSRRKETGHMPKHFWPIRCNQHLDDNVTRSILVKPRQSKYQNKVQLAKHVHSKQNWNPLVTVIPKKVIKPLSKKKKYLCI